MASATAKVSEQLKQCQKILQFLMSHKDAEPFLNPVDWKLMGLVDYPKVVKTPMDLGSVKAKLERGDYSSSKEFRHDANLVWTNCMTYNADGSDYYLIASNLKKVFEEKYAKMIKEEEEPRDPARPPTLVDKKMCCQNIYNISAEDLGKVVQLLDQRCESCIKKIDPEDIEIDIDAIDPSTFWTVDNFIKDCLPGGKKYSKKRQGAGGSGAAAEAANKAKKSRVA